jgi:hypothetical protein
MGAIPGLFVDRSRPAYVVDTKLDRGGSLMNDVELRYGRGGGSTRWKVTL